MTTSKYKIAGLGLGLGLGLGISILAPSFANEVYANETKVNFYVSGVAANDTLNIRDINTLEVLEKVKNGDIVTKIENLEWKKGWVKVKTSNGTVGICNARYLSTQKNGNNSNIKVTSKTIELRSGAGYNYKVQKTLPKGTEVELLSINGDWAKVKHNGMISFCPKFYIVNFSSNTITETKKENTTVNTNNESNSKVYTSSASITTRKSNANSVKNATVALNKLNGYRIKRGAKFSFLEAVGKINYANGFVDSTILRNGKKDTGVGGGVCLASTAVYNAMLDAGIKPLQRRNHSLASTYVGRGLDAMISTGSSDLSFINNTGKELVINTKVANGLATVTFSSVGDHKNGYTYKTRVELSDNGSRAKTYLQTIKNGIVISDDLVSTSYYLN